MTLTELYERLALGEMNQHSWGASGTIPEDKRPAILNYLNSGLDQLHARFPLSEKEVIIQQMENITIYYLDYAYADSNTASTEPKYIMDTAEDPFMDDVIRIERAYDEGGCPIPLNNVSDPCAWFTPSWDSIQIPYPIVSNVAVFMYRAKHRKLLITDDPDTTLIYLPPTLEEAIAAYIASRAYVSMGNATSGQLSSYYNSRYNEQVEMVDRYNLLQSSEGDDNLKLGMKGFV